MAAYGPLKRSKCYLRAAGCALCPQTVDLLVRLASLCPQAVDEPREKAPEGANYISQDSNDAEVLLLTSETVLGGPLTLLLTSETCEIDTLSI